MDGGLAWSRAWGRGAGERLTTRMLVTDVPIEALRLA